MSNETISTDGKEGKVRSDAVMDLIDILQKQGKTYIKGIIYDEYTNTKWSYQVKKV